MDSSVVVVGSINEDVVIRVDRRPLPGETVRALSVRRFAGGKGANQAVAAARAGARVAMVGCVGDDPAGVRMVEALRAEKVATDLVRGLPGARTGAAFITVTPDGENTIITDPGANGRLELADVEAAGDLLATSALVAQLEVPVDVVAAAVGAAVAAGTRAVVTLAPAQPVPGHLLAGLDPVVVNEHEAAFYLGRRALGDPEEVAGRLLELGPASAVVTLGSRGAAIADRTGRRLLPAVPVGRVEDTTGAGDAFSGALAAALAAGAALDQAVSEGLRAAADVIGRPGAR